ANAEGGAALFLPGVPEHPFGDVHPGHPGAPPGQDAGVVSLAAAGVEDVLAGQIPDELEERRIVQSLPGDVVALANLARPRVGVAVPVAGDLGLGELLTHGSKRAPSAAAMGLGTQRPYIRVAAE